MDLRSGPPSADRVRILIADDDRLFAEMLRAALAKRDGIDVIGIASDGHAAYALARELEPAIVLMDAAMPGVDGYEATRLIRRLPRPPTVVFISGVDARSGNERALNAGASAYFKKTDDLAELIDFLVAWADVHALLT
ncbi:MAG TPA: response regulator transcription factor [Gaiellaceae bacterium]|jgi:DNA-binding NarL/FixJ family response regulator|nr:response regulator transcription factor [Gaiellaceae bacterium]